MFYLWQIAEKKITKSKVDVTFKGAAGMSKDDKASLSENDLMLHVDFAGSYKNNQKDAIQSACFGNQCFKLFTACCYAESSHNNNIINDNVTRPRHSRVYELPANSCPQD